MSEKTVEELMQDFLETTHYQENGKDFTEMDLGDDDDDDVEEGRMSQAKRLVDALNKVQG